MTYAGTEEKEGKFVQSVERAINIIEVMAEEAAPVTVTELADKVNLKISTVHRLLSTLMHRGYVEQDENNKYKLGLKLMEIGNKVQHFADLRAVARPYLEELVDRCNETANLSILDNTEVVYIDQVESNNLIIVKMFAQVGNRGPVHCTASGKVLVAFLPQEKIEEILDKISLDKYTDKTISDARFLEKELGEIRKAGYALDLGEREEHVRCVAAPVFNHEGRVLASLSVSGPSTRINDQYLTELKEIVKDVAHKISVKMGFQDLSNEETKA